MGLWSRVGDDTEKKGILNAGFELCDLNGRTHCLEQPNDFDFLFRHLIDQPMQGNLLRAII